MNVSPSVALSRCFRSPRFSFDVKKVVEERERERERRVKEKKREGWTVEAYCDSTFLIKV